MKILLFIAALLISDPIGKLNRVAKTNSIKKEAKAAFEAEDYKTAIQKYAYLIDSLKVEDDQILLNLANAYFKSSDSSQALSNYQKLTSSNDTKIQSVANQQLGVMSNNPKQLQTSLDYFKKALKADPTNEEARYNYELVKKLLEEQKKKEQEQKDKNKDKKDDKKDEKDQKKDQEKKDDKNKENKDKKEEEKDKEKGDKQDQEKQEKGDKEQEQKDQEKSEQEKQEQEKQKKEGQKDEENKKEKDQKKEMPQSTKEKLQQMKISPEKAKMILEAMKNQEVQYIQQSKKKAKKKAKNNKPDW